jgi:hypothetical protein
MIILLGAAKRPVPVGCLPFLVFSSLNLVMDDEDWNQPECDIPGVSGKVLDAA